MDTQARELIRGEVDMYLPVVLSFFCNLIDNIFY